MTIVKSMRGDSINTELFKIKEQLSKGQQTDPTIKRESYVNDRRRRSSSRRVSEMLANEQMVKQKLNEQKVIKEAESIVTDVLSTGVDESELHEQTTHEPEESLEVTSVPESTPVHKRIIKKQG